MIKDVDGKISGSIRSLVPVISGRVTSKGSVTGRVDPVGQKIIYNTYWGGITGEIERQEDLMTQLHDRDNQALTVQEIEKILYLG